ncbi:MULTISPECIES: P-II family nitrogen regulator [Desulfofundulus]|uniref:Nitrogen regulatory protein P-II n=1 Tax=Desulfofundulus kuznetsovii (strain DSM 6115 / VKM B-1805 / 17) TaxID=760568 RepID=A0AAU8PCV6_DESK7|nr:MULTISPECIES: P-II family nitrogen regulator [Desulfofundulus]AEG16829.1 nitrogen regulatory protein P-II [Desulfofundulus kuznetsovii DSM 6115]MCS5695378.1 P-II family nitrogen regulator [Desulfofundulus thermocisternus]NHM28867.1 P-II family nitrogen regulator [Desulfofundulus sp. TPOSR]
MKMIRAIIRPEKSEEVVDALAEAGYVALTKMDVVGRGKQKGIHVGSIYYDELPKVMIMLVVEDDKAAEVVEIVTRAAYTGNFGDGKIFITPVDEAYTVRTGAAGL